MDFRSGATTTVDVELLLLDLDRVVDRVQRRYRLSPGRSRRIERVALPSKPRRGYGLKLDVRWPGGSAAAESAVEALDGWWQSPRHAAITEFGSPVQGRRRIQALRNWHVTVVQHYDWMYRHYLYAPPRGDTFLDALGRRVSHRAVRAIVREGHRAGIASLAYGSVYGAEREYVDAHPSERVFDEAGVSLSLGETFYINDLRPASPWRARLLSEYERACRGFGFDGIHMDTYGPPHHAVAADGEAIDFASLYPGLIADGASRVAAAREGGRVLFNCVEGFPLETVAGAPTAAVYLELWPPDVAYHDIVRWTDRARALGGGKQVVIAAYISALRAAAEDAGARAGAVEAAVLLTCVIAVAGGYHHVLAEGDRVLVEGYYPEARKLARAEGAELLAAWAFSARYVHLLSDPAAVPNGIGGLELRDDSGRPVPVSDIPAAGSVWVRATATPSGRVFQLIDLTGQSSDRWDDVRQPSPLRRGWAISLPGAVAPVAASPWHRRGAAMPVPARGTDGEWRLPAFRRWVLVVG